jgi:hypothetical protein
MYELAFIGIRTYSMLPTKGRSAIARARLIASVKARWWLAHVPEIRLGIILPRSVIKYFKDLLSL